MSNTKLILFPAVGRIEPFESFLNARTVVQVTHRLDLMMPVNSEDQFRLRDALNAEVQILATLKGKAKEADTEVVVKRFIVDVPPSTSIFLDSQFFQSLDEATQKKLKKRAWTITSYQERMERQERYRFDEPEGHPHGHNPSGQPTFSSNPTTLSLPQTPMGSYHAAPSRHYEIQPQETLAYETAVSNFSKFMNKKNAKLGGEPVEYKLSQFYSLLNELSPASPETADTIRKIESRIETEVGGAIKILG